MNTLYIDGIGALSVSFEYKAPIIWRLPFQCSIGVTNAMLIILINLDVILLISGDIHLIPYSFHEL